jgi:hypothetical protein
VPSGLLASKRRAPRKPTTLLTSSASSRMVMSSPTPTLGIGAASYSFVTKRHAAAGTLRFTRSRDRVHHVVATGEGEVTETVDVSVTTLNEIASGRTPALIKVDVEGFETAVFAGAQATLANPTLQALIVELNGSGARYGFDEAALRQQFESFGFRPYAYELFTRRLLPTDARNAEGNALYLRDAGEVQTRVRKAPTVQVTGVTL